MQSRVVLEDGVVSVGEIPRVTGITIWPSGGCLRVHVALDPGEVADHVAEREAAGARRPLEIVARNARDDALRALVHSRMVIDEDLRVADFHRTEKSRGAGVDTKKQRDLYTPATAAVDRGACVSNDTRESSVRRRCALSCRRYW